MSRREFPIQEADFQGKKEMEPEELFESIDQEDTLFAYGSLLDPENVANLLKDSRDGEAPKVYEAKDLKEASALSRQENPPIVILRNVLLEGVRAQIITDKQLLSAYEQKFGESYPVSDESPEQYLYVRKPIKKEKVLKSGKKIEEMERGRRVNGGLLIGLTKKDLERLDKHEDMKEIDGVQDGIYMRQLVPQVTIENKNFTPKNISFYGGNVGDFHNFIDPENSEQSRLDAIKKVKPKAETSGRNLGELPESAYWPHTPEHEVRRKRGSDPKE